MTKWLDPIRETQAHLIAENAKLREVNAAQAEQLRKAQERIRAAEAERDRALRMADVAADTLRSLAKEPRE